MTIEQLRLDLLREFEHVADNKGLDYAVNVAVDIPKSIVTDPNRLGQILKNLLANAFKFTEQGEVRLDVTLVASGWNPEISSLNQAGSVLALAVRDTGIGVEPEQQQRIFEAFAQGDGTTARLYGGTGLGLSISRELVGLLGGEITVASTPGQGSTFTVFLPADPAQEWEAAPALPGTNPVEGTPKISADLAGVNVLVVDDDFRNLFAMTALFERCHANVTVAESGHNAIVALQQESDFDVILMDIMMPIMDGYTVIRTIRNMDRFASIPIIAVTGKVIPGERERCMAAGANDFVAKPVDVADLLATIRPWVPANFGSMS